MNNNTQSIRQIIGRVSRTVTRFWVSVTTNRQTADETRPDYQFWDEVRRGKKEHYKLGGLFFQAIVEIVAAWVMGDGITIKLAEQPSDPDNPTDPINYTNDALQRFFGGLFARTLTLYQDSMALGDQYAVVNADGSLSFPSPDTVHVQTDPLDYTNVQGYEIITVVGENAEIRITDTYTALLRTVSIQIGDSPPSVSTFPNPTGRIPVIHFACDRGGNEVYGRPIYERLLKLIQRYDDIINKAVDGAELTGNPLPVFENLKNPQATRDALLTEEDEEYTDLDGNTVDRDIVKWDRLGIIFLGEGGRASFLAPQVGFTDDLRNILKALFLLLLDTMHIPEFVWGGAIASSKASAEAQMPAFMRFIKGRQRMLEGIGEDDVLGRESRDGLLALADRWLRMRQLFDPLIQTGPVVIDWPELTDENQQLALEWTRWLYSQFLISDETALQLSGLVENPTAELERAAQGREMLDEEDEDFEGRLEGAAAQAA